MKKKKLVKVTMHHLRLLASMINSGISPVDAFQSFKNKDYEELIVLCMAGESYSNIFRITTLSKSGGYIDLIEAAENVGAVPRALEAIADIYEKNQTRVSQFIGVLVYPVIICLITFALLSMVLLFVVPTIAPIIKAGGDLSFVTKLMIVSSDSLKKMGYVYIILGIVLLISIIVAIKNQRSRSVIETSLVNIPRLKDLFINFNCLGYTLILKSYIEYTRDIPNAFRKTGADTKSMYFKSAFIEVAKSVESGKLLSDAIDETGRFPVVWTMYLRAGERSSTYVSMLNLLHEYYARVFQAQVGLLLKLSEPVLMVIIGLVVGIIAYGILSPLYGLMGQFS